MKASVERLEEANRVKDDFLYTCAEEYFKVIVEALRRHDPNHLVLGIRFAENPNNRWVEMSRLFDVFSVNIYSREFMPDPKNIERFSDVSGKPVLIGEFTACAAGRGLQGLFYGVHKVRDQAELHHKYHDRDRDQGADGARCVRAQAGAETERDQMHRLAHQAGVCAPLHRRSHLFLFIRFIRQGLFIRVHSSAAK